MHCRYVAFEGINDYYQEGVEIIKLDTKKRSEQFVILKSKFSISSRNILNKLGLVSEQLLFSILYKNKPSTEIIRTLKDEGWEYKILLKNPLI